MAQTRAQEQARYEIDAKRYGLNVKSDEALASSREYIRLDSTYYVGWMLEGMYKYERSADVSGFRNALFPLKKAFEQLTLEFDEVFTGMFSDYKFMEKNLTRFHDLMILVNALRGAFDNTDQPDSTVAILNKIKKYKFKVDNLEDYSFGQYAHRAWLYHRNRFYTSKNFTFLKNTVQDNEKEAYNICYQGLHFANENKELSDEWFGEDVNIIDRLRIYHNLTILHTYNKQYDSSAYYYALLNDYGVVSKNNYASMLYELANFADADYYYQQAIEEAQDYSLQEPFYFLPQLYIFSGKIKEAIAMDKEIINKRGSTPGFGWYNIALARSYLYNGQLDSCNIALNKAINFNEVHIGTTLTQSQYEFTIRLLRVQLLEKQIAKVKFQNRGWWYSPGTLWRLLSLKIEKWVAVYNTSSQLAANPDKDRMVFDLFCSEATTTYDEAWWLLKNFSSSYFEKKYKNLQNTDKRENVDRYFKLFEAKFQLEGGKSKTARESFDRILKNVALDTTYEKLYIGRLYEGTLLATKIVSADYDKYCNALYTYYPELIPFSGIQMSMQLNISGADNATIKKIKDQIKKARVDWSIRDNIPTSNIFFEQRGDKYRAVINTFNAQGKQIVKDEEIFFSKTSGTGQEIVMRIFGKGGAQNI